ncbi:MAG: hypothetical protein LBK06_01210 [Planctomycetaceae bacterium]|nr:hypothetical protein [Planctomycetaceae bacterium]
MECSIKSKATASTFPGSVPATQRNAFNEELPISIPQTAADDFAIIKIIFVTIFLIYAEAVLKFGKLNTQAQQRGAIVQGRSLPPYRLRYT